MARTNAESAAIIWARAAFSSNGAAAVLDAAVESEVAGAPLLQAHTTTLTRASERIAEVRCMFPPTVEDATMTPCPKNRFLLPPPPGRRRVCPSLVTAGRLP